MKLFLAFLLTVAAAAAGPATVYVSNGAGQSISLFDLDRGSGELTARGEVALVANPGPLVLSADKRTVYAALRAAKSVQSLRVGADGGLTVGAVVPIELNPAYLFIDRTGRNLLAADYGGDRVAAYRLGEDGVASPTAACALATGKNPHSIQTDPANRFAFAPLCGGDQLLQFRFDAATGMLEPHTPPGTAFQAGDGPRHFAFSPSGNFVYVVNEKSSSVTTLAYGAAAGTFEVLETLPTIPSDAVKNSCADIHLTPDGNFLYASNRGHDSLAAFAIDAKTGRLKALGQTPTEKTPRSFAIDASGEFLLAAGQGSNQLAVYRVSKSGELQPLKVYPVGKGPAWVLAVER